MDYRKTKIEYVRYYMPGSEALALEPQQSQRTHRRRSSTAQTPVAQVKPLVISVDPLAAVAIFVAVVMVVLMCLGISQLRTAQAEQVTMQSYIENLEQDNRDLTEYFESGYSLEAVEKAALSLGLVPMEEVAHLQVSMDPVPVEPVEEPSFLDGLYSFLCGLFA